MVAPTAFDTPITSPNGTAMTALTSEGLTKIVPAIIAAQKSFKPALKDSVNPAFKSKYVSLDSVLEAVTEALLNNGIALLQQTDRDDDGTTILLTRLIHTSGEWVGSRYPVRPVKQDPQGEGSALTYSRRYSLMALVGIAPEDDDGNAASRSPKRDEPKAEPKLNEDEFNELMTAVTEAQTVDELNRAGQHVAKAEMPSDAKAALRSAFTSRMADLKKAAK